MILYKNNPNLHKTVVTTIMGDKEYRSNCKYIKGDYYVLNRDCFEINGTCYRTNSGKIAYDNEYNRWVIKNKNLIEGIVDIKDDNVVKGYFTPNPLFNCTVHFQGGIYTAINTKILKDLFVENKGTGIFYFKKHLSALQISKFENIHNELDYTRKGYNIEDNAEEFKTKCELHKVYCPDISLDAKEFGKLLGNTTWGFEAECSVGALPDHIQHQNGLVSCRDGSINGGPEFVSIPLQGPKGLQTMNNAFLEMQKRCNIDINCSLHIHTGNIPLHRDYIVALYMLGYRIQDEMFKMFPGYKTDPRGIKRKNYCQKLKPLSILSLKQAGKEAYKEFIDDAYYKIFTFLSCGTPPNRDINTRVHTHPIREKWNRTNRYVWLNLEPMIFSSRGTCEHRLMTGTLNPVKATAWLYICNAIVKFAEKNVLRIVKEEGNISLEEVLNYYRIEFPHSDRAAFISDYLLAFYNKRCKEFKKDVDKGDRISEWDLIRDKDWKFSYQGISSLV